MSCMGSPYEEAAELTIQDDDVAAFANPSAGSCAAWPPTRSCLPLPLLKQTRRKLLDRRNHGLLCDGARIGCRRRARGIFERLTGNFDELFGSFELAVFLAQLLQFESKGLACSRRQSTADLRAKRSAKEGAGGCAGEGERLLCHPLEYAAQRFADRRLGDASHGLRGLLENTAQKAIEFGLIANFEQLSGEFHLLRLIEDFIGALTRPLSRPLAFGFTFSGPLSGVFSRPLGFAPCGLFGLVRFSLRVVFHKRSIHHDPP